MKKIGIRLDVRCEIEEKMAEEREEHFKNHFAVTVVTVLGILSLAVIAAALVWYNANFQLNICISV